MFPKLTKSWVTLGLISGLAPASPMPIGFLSFDSGNPGATAGVFDIANLTGANDSTFPDTSFPVATPLTFSNILLTVNFLGGGSTVLNSSNFNSDGGGGFTGTSTFDLAAFPIASASLTGDLSPQTVTLNDGVTE